MSSPQDGVEWVVLEEVASDSARLIALKIATGERRAVYRSNHSFPLRPSVHPRGIRIAVDAVSKSPLRGDFRARVGVVNLESGGIGWLRQSLDPKWRIGGAVFDDTGTRLALEGAYDGAPLPDIYVYQVGFHGNSVKEKVTAGAGSREGLGLRRPLFLPGGERLVYLRNTRADGAWEICLLDLSHPGDSAAALGGRAPSVFTHTLTHNAAAIPENGLGYCECTQRVFFVTRTLPRSRQQICSVSIDGGPVQPIGDEFLHVEDVKVAPGGEVMAFSADGQLWLADVETGAAVPLIGGDASSTHRGLTFDLHNGRLLFCTTDPSGASIRSVQLESRQVEDLRFLGEHTTVVGVTQLVSTPLLENLPEEDNADRWQAGAAAPGQYPWATEVSSAVQAPDSDQTNLTTDVSARTDVAETAPEDPDRLSAAAGAAPLDLDAPALSTTLPEAGELAAQAVAEVGQTTGRDTDLVSPASGFPGSDPSGPSHGSQAPVATELLVDVGDTTTASLHADVVPGAQPGADEPARPTAQHDTRPVAAISITAAGAKPAALSTTGTLPTANEFESWMHQIGDHGDPAVQLKALEMGEPDEILLGAAVEHLKTQARRTELAPEAVTDLVFSIGANAHLRNMHALVELEEICRRAADRLAGGDALPEVEEHFALAALRFISGQHSAFHFAEAYDDYEQILADTALALHRDGDAAAQDVMTSFANHYRQMFAEILALRSRPPVDMAVSVLRPQAEFDPRDDAEAADRRDTATDNPLVAPAEIGSAPAGTDECATPAAGAAPVATPETAPSSSAEGARREDSGAESAGARASEPAPVDGEEHEWKRLHAAALRDAGREEEDEWGKARAAAEGAAEPDHAEAVADAATPDEDIEWEKQRAAAEEAARAEAEVDWARPRPEELVSQDAPESVRPDPDEDREWAAAQEAARIAAEAERAAEAARQAVEVAEQAAAEAARAKARMSQSIVPDQSPAEIGGPPSRNARGSAPIADSGTPTPQPTPTSRPAHVSRIRPSPGREAAKPNPFASIAVTPPPQSMAAPTNPRPSARSLYGRQPPNHAGSLDVTPSSPEGLPPQEHAGGARRPTTAYESNWSSPNPAPLPTEAPRARPAAEAADLGFEVPLEPSHEVSFDLPSATARPWFLSAAALVSAAAGLTQVLVGIELGALFVILGMAGLIVGAGLLGDRRWGWITGVLAFPLNAVALVYYASGAPPAWVPPPLLYLGAGAALVMFGLLLHPAARSRFSSPKARY